MQKFEEGDGPLSERRNIVVMVDEAHRSQYGLEEHIDPRTGRVRVGAARLVRNALPNATYIGFTGTPIAQKDRSTREVFGDYIDVYDMTQAVEDGAHAPDLLREPRRQPPPRRGDAAPHRCRVRRDGRGGRGVRHREEQARVGAHRLDFWGRCDSGVVVRGHREALRGVPPMGADRQGDDCGLLAADCDEDLPSDSGDAPGVAREASRGDDFEQQGSRGVAGRDWQRRPQEGARAAVQGQCRAAKDRHRGGYVADGVRRSLVGNDVCLQTGGRATT